MTIRPPLPTDLRFEHMDEAACREAAWRFVCAAHLLKEDQVAPFVAEHAHEIEQLTCFFPVVHLSMRERASFQGSELIPAGEAELPKVFLGPDPRPMVASVIGVPTEGTNRGNMSERGAVAARHALRLLRIGLRDDHWVADRQLRFQLGASFWFSDSLGGFKTPAEQGWDYEIDRSAVEQIAASPLGDVPLEGGTGVEKAARRAVTWFEHSQLATDPLVEILMLTFAVEALLGRKSGKLKARELALRRAILSHHATGSFAHPGRFYLVYDQIRSVAVHGGDPPGFDDDLVQTVAWDVRRAISEYLSFAQERGFTGRGKLLAALDGDPNTTKIAERFLPDD